MSLDRVPAVIAQAQLRVRSSADARLGPLRVDIRSNEEQFVGLRYFPSRALSPRESPPDYTLHFCNLNADGPWLREQILEQQDRHYRARRFASGYYITDHFGAPAFLFSRDTHYWTLGENFEPILWPYFAKLLLTLYSMEHRLLHLKAAAISVDGTGTLLVGRGGGGKTVLLAQLCQHGAKFLSNTHTLVDAGTLIGVPAAMRIRNDAIFGPLIRARGLSVGIKSGEYLIDPLADLGWATAPTAPLRNICIVDYKGTNGAILEIDRAVLREYMHQFSLALTVYGLKEDVLDHLGGDIEQLALHVSSMRTILDAAIEQCRAYYVSCDVTDPASLHALLNKLSG